MTELTTLGKIKMILHTKNNISGFTLVEILVTLVMSLVISGAVYSFYITQQRSYTSQDQTVEMQQNIRAAIASLQRDLRMAGYNPTGGSNIGFVKNVNFFSSSGTAEAVTSSSTQIAFTVDLNRNGLVDLAVQDINGNGNTDLEEMEQVAYRLGGASGMELQRYSVTTGAIEWQTVAEYIELLEFFYILSDGTTRTNPTAAELPAIRSVRISLLARSQNQDQSFVNTTIYTPASGNQWSVGGAAAGSAPRDHYRRRLMIATIQCRNMGL